MYRENFYNIFEFYKPQEIKRVKLKDLRYLKTNPWLDDRYKLKYPEFYSKSLIEQFKKYFNAAIEYLEGSLLTAVEKKYKIYRESIKNIAKDLLDGETIENLLKRLIGYKGKNGLHLAVAELKTFFHENNKIPICNEKCMITIRNSILSSKNWSEFGINSWNDILEYVYGKEFLKKWKDSEDEKIFEKAISELKDFYKIKGRLPKYSDRKIRWISGSVTNGRWKKFKIKTWNDLLKKVFGEINLEHNIYQDKEGFNKAVEELKVFYEKNGRKPTIKDFEPMVGAIYRGALTEFGIKKWNDMVKHVFGEVNLLFQNKYTEKDGLANIKQELKVFKEKNDRLPKSNDEEMSLIKGAVRRRLFKDQGIKTWNDLLKNTFGTINREQNFYEGKKGFDKAILELKNYYKINNKIPTTGEFDVIYRNIRRGVWKRFSINTWEDFIIFCFGEKSIKFNKYKGEEGFKRAKQDLIEFEKINGKIPTQKDMGSIVYAIRKGEYKKNGINAWNDLLLLMFGKINAEPNKYIGQQGLDNAIKVLQKYKKKYGKKPTSKNKGMSGIMGAIQRGTWREYGINSWNDLLINIFGEINTRKSKFEGKKGLEKVRLKLLNYKKVNCRKPTSKNKGMSGIKGAIRKGIWKEFDIYSWNDLLQFTFGETNAERNIYNGQEGLNIATQKLKDYKIRSKKMPKSNSKGMGGIIGAIRKGFWKDNKINSWNDLLRYTFGEVNRIRDKYIGEIGLKRAIQELLDYKRKKGKIPTAKIGTIYNIVRRGEWKDFGINSWKKLLVYVFGDD